MKTYEQPVAGILTQVLDDIEDERVRPGKKRIVLNSTLPYGKIVEDINKTCEKEFLEGKKIDEGVEILSPRICQTCTYYQVRFILKN